MGMPSLQHQIRRSGIRMPAAYRLKAERIEKIGHATITCRPTTDDIDRAR